MDIHSIALVTGSAHRLGRAIALSLAEEGYAILVHYRKSSEKAKRTADEVRSIGVPAALVQADLTNEDGINGILLALDLFRATTGYGFDLLVNSAASMQRVDIRNLTYADWDATISLNLRAPFFLAQKAAERMKNGGNIINITDSGVNKLWTHYPAYVISKSSLGILTRLLAKEYAPDIRVNGIAPGLVYASESMPGAVWEKIVARLPLNRQTPPDDISSALKFILHNSSITGQVIVVDCGFSLE